MVEKTARKEMRVLAERLRALLEEHLLESPDVAALYLSEAKKIRKEITRHGYLVQWSATLNPITRRITVDAELYEPREHLSPELQKIYDEWFLKANAAREGNPDGTEL